MSDMMDEYEEEDSDLEFQRMMGLSDEELERETAIMEQEFVEWVNSLNPEERYRYWISSTLDLCVRIRKSLRTAPDMHVILMDTLRRSQRRLWTMREERRTGMVGSTAVN